LITLRITDRVRQALGADAPEGAAFRGSTVERMARAVERAPDIGPSSPLVPIQTGGSRPPLFFVHPAAGVVFPYFELAPHLGGEPAPVYGHRPTAAIMGKMLLTGMARTIWPHLHDYLYLLHASGNQPNNGAANGVTNGHANGVSGRRWNELVRLGSDGQGKI